MTSVVRWGRSAYETDAGLAAEAAAVRALGCRWRSSTAANLQLQAGEVLVVTSGVGVTVDVLRQRPAMVLTTTSGYDHIDIEAAARLKIPVCRCPMARRDAVVESTIGGILWWNRRFGPLRSAALGGHWARGDLPDLAPVGLAGLPVAVVGCGVIGRKVIEVLRAFDSQILAVDPWATVPDGIPVVSLQEAMTVARVVTLHCRLDPGSDWLIDEAMLDQLGPDALVVNTARGRCLDVGAAIRRVNEGRLGGVVADVFPVEPYPELGPHSQSDRVLLTPHASGYTHDLAVRVKNEVEAALLAFTTGSSLPHRVA